MIMSVLEIVSGILLLLAGMIIVIVVVLQESKQENLSTITGGGGSDSYFGKNKTRTREATLSRITKILATSFFLITIAVSIFNAIG